MGWRHLWLIRSPFWRCLGSAGSTWTVILYLCFLPKMLPTSVVFYCLFITTETLWIYMAFMLCCCCYFSESGKEREVNAFAQPPTFYNLLHLHFSWPGVFTEKTRSCVHLEVVFSPVKDSESESHSVMSDSSQPHRLYSSWNSPGQNTGVGSLSLLQGSFPTQGLNPGLPHCRQILYQLSHKGSPRIMEWVPYPFSSRSSRSKNGTGVSCIAGGFFTNSAIREALNNSEENVNWNWQYYQEKTFSNRLQNWTLIRMHVNR